MPPLLELTAVDLAWPAGPLVVRAFHLSLLRGAVCALVGPTAVGKSTILAACAGQLRPQAGTYTCTARCTRLVSFANPTGGFRPSAFFYQQRYHGTGGDDGPTLADFLGSAPEVPTVAEQFGLGGRLFQPMVTLSSGQTRRARLARAWLARPDLLLLDDPFLGLDAAGRAELGAWLQVGQPTAPTVLFTAHPAEVPAWATQVVAVAPVPTVPTGPPVIELRKVRVRYGSRLILDDVTWIVRASERWALVGPNGAGKSTLLALVAGDHPQAYANDVALFGQRRGAGATIWELKQRLGLVSAELHVYFAEPLSVAQVVASGWHDGLVPRALTPAQTAGVAATLAEFGLTHLAERGWRTLSTGEQRLALFARAVVKRPEVLILDEPFQSLDMAWIARLRGWLDTHLQPTQTLLFVTHVPTEVPTSVRHVARLHNGQLSVG